MVKTPWGDAETLRDRKLRPGRRLPPELVARNQRARLFGALVAAVADKGYEATRVADLLELSGVSRSAFYEHFEDKKACLFGAIEALGRPLLQRMADPEAMPADEESARAGFEAFARLIVEQSAASQMSFVEIYGAGQEGADLLDEMIDAFQRYAQATLAKIGRDGVPPEIVRAVIGGLRKLVHTRLYRGAEEELIVLAPQAWDWALSYQPPPQPLRRPRVRPPASGGAGYDQAERILRALAAVVAEKGYPAMTVGDVAARASISLSTFYAHFSDKEEAMLAAVDSGSAQMLAATLPAFRRTPDWPHAVRAAYGAMFAFAAAEPDYTTLGAVDVYAAGKRALKQRDQIMQNLQVLLVPGYERSPETSLIVSEAIGGTIHSMIYDQIKRGGAQSMQEIAPLATYLTLAPFIGADEACQAANGDGRAR